MGRGLGQGMREFKDGVTGRGVEPTITAIPEKTETRERVSEG